MCARARVHVFVLDVLLGKVSVANVLGIETARMK